MKERGLKVVDIRKKKGQKYRRICMNKVAKYLRTVSMRRHIGINNNNNNNRKYVIICKDKVAKYLRIVSMGRGVRSNWMQPTLRPSVLFT